MKKISSSNEYGIWVVIYFVALILPMAILLYFSKNSPHYIESIFMTGVFCGIWFTIFTWWWWIKIPEESERQYVETQKELDRLEKLRVSNQIREEEKLKEEERCRRNWGSYTATEKSDIDERKS